jgi:hypothetical protein
MAHLLWQWLGQVLISGIGAILGVIALLFSSIGGKLLDFFFNQRIEKVRSKLEGEIEELKTRLAVLGDRGVRSNEREYNAIVAAWEVYVEAHNATLSCVARFDNVPDLRRMDEQEFREWAQTMDIGPKDIQTIWDARDRNQMYGRYAQMKAINKALRVTYDARLILGKQGIFIPRALEDEFKKTLEALSMVHAGEMATLENRATENSKKWVEDFLANGQRNYDALKDVARERLMYDEARQRQA